MTNLKDLWITLIHSIKLLYYRIRGYISRREGKVIVNGTEMTIAEFMEQFSSKKVDCRICGDPINAMRGQIVKYHKYCRKFRHNRYGFKKPI